MTNYLNFRVDLADAEFVTTFDELTYWSALFGQLLFRHLPLAPNLAVLDIGCGTGFPLLELADRLGPGSNVQGIDAWVGAVDRARLKARVRGNENVQVTHGDAVDMPFDDDSFDLIVSNLGLNNFAAPEAVMAECRRVCRPDGRLALTTNLIGHMSEFYQIYEQTLIDTGSVNLVNKLQEQQAHRATRAGLHKMLSAAGFEVTAFQTDTFTLRYADGSALLNAYLSRLGFLEGWQRVLQGTGLDSPIFAELEERLNTVARASGEGLRLSIPAAYIEGRKIQ